MILKKGSKGEEVKELQKILHIYPDGIFGSITEEAVKEYQRTNGLTPDGIVGEKTWAKLKANSSTLKKSRRTINELIVHCSATKEGKDYTVADIKRWHLDRGFSDIGYHYVIYRDGSLHLGRDVNIGGAHCTNHNAKSIGICYIGGLDSAGNPKDTRTDKQKEALLKLLKQLKSVYPRATVHGHREYANKACPCFDAKKEYCNI